MRPARAAQAVVEVGPGPEWLQAPVVSRLVQLELSDVDIPEPHDARTHDPLGGVYVRVRVVEGFLVVQLWDRGELEGQRRVAIQEGRSLLPRRVALIAAELARRLAAGRTAQAKRAERQALRDAKLAREDQWTWRGVVPSLGGGARAASIGFGDAWLFGSHVQGRLRFGQGPQLSLGLAALTGPTPTVDGAGASQWFEMSLEPSYSFGLGGKSALSVGADVGAATVHFSGVEAVDAVAGQQQTWSATALLVASYQARLTPSTTLEISPQFGAVLRRIPVMAESGETMRLGGVWAGLRVSVDVAGLGVDSTQR